MSLRNMSAWSIRNPIVPLTVFAGLLLAGIVAFIRMDVNDLPDVDFPMVTVSVVQPGAAPSEITSQITEKVEADMRRVLETKEPGYSGIGTTLSGNMLVLAAMPLLAPAAVILQYHHVSERTPPVTSLMRLNSTAINTVKPEPANTNTNPPMALARKISSALSSKLFKANSSVTKFSTLSTVPEPTAKLQRITPATSRITQRQK